LAVASVTPAHWRFRGDFCEEDFGGPEDGDVAKEEDMSQVDENRDPGDEFDPLYVDIGGEG
jgi:hypothetical protein